MKFWKYQFIQFCTCNNYTHLLIYLQKLVLKYIIKLVKSIQVQIKVSYEPNIPIER